MPSGASVDDLAVVIGQFGSIQRILISSRGARGAGNALIVLPQASASEVAEALDSYPLSGGLLESRVCHDTASWVRRYVGHQVGRALLCPPRPAGGVASNLLTLPLCSCWTACRLPLPRRLPWPSRSCRRRPLPQYRCRSLWRLPLGCLKASKRSLWGLWRASMSPSPTPAAGRLLAPTWSPTVWVTRAQATPSP